MKKYLGYKKKVIIFQILKKLYQSIISKINKGNKIDKYEF